MMVFSMSRFEECAGRAFDRKRPRLADIDSPDFNSAGLSAPEETDDPHDIPSNGGHGRCPSDDGIPVVGVKSKRILGAW